MDTISLLEKAFQSLPQSQETKDIKFHIYQAITKLKNLKDKKKPNRPTPLIPSPNLTKETLSALDEMIAKEKALLNTIQKDKVSTKETLMYEQNI